MAVAVELLFDDAAATAVRALWSRLESAGIASLATVTHGLHRPHVTLLNANALTITPALIDPLRPLVGSELSFDSLAIFPGTTSVLFLTARVTQPLLTAHTAACDLIAAEHTAPWPQYRPGAWVPHCTLAGGLDSAAVRRALGLLHPFRSIQAEIAEICAVDTRTGRHTTLIAV